MMFPFRSLRTMSTFRFRSRTLIFAGTLLASGVAAAWADESDTTFSGGNKAYEDGRFEDAERVYRKMTDQGLVSEELFYNLGNALYRLDRPGEAALWYRRALVIEPRFAEARQNLVVIQKKEGYHEFQLEGVDAWLSRLGRGEIVGILLTGIWIAVLALAAVWALPRWRDWRPLLFVTAALGVAVSAAAIWGLRRQATQVTMEDLAIVIANETTARTQPVSDSEPVVELPPGSELRIIQRRGPWTYVGIPEELRGWVRTESIAPVYWYGPHGAPDVTPGIAQIR